MEVTREQFFYELASKFVFLFREFVNLCGWDHKKKLMGYGIIEQVQITHGEYCANNTCEEVPELMNDFVGVFLHLDTSFACDVKDVVDICQNFCFWLFINKFTLFKLSKTDEGDLNY
jgi:hypothetical protein